MDAIFRGTRGGVPAPGPDTVRFGGNTTALQITAAAGETVILGAGTGILTIGRATPMPSGDLAIILAHLHWDDIQGLPFFDPLFDPARTITIYGPRPSPEMSLREGLRMQMQPPHFPATFDEAIAADVHFVEVNPCAAFAIGTLQITPHQVVHPGTTLAYRIDEAGTHQSLAFAPENELPAMPPATVAAMAAWARDVDVLVHDAQYTEEEYPAKRGWGHSTFDAALALARSAGARSLAFTHHDPTRGDAALATTATAAVVRDARRHGLDPLHAFAAAEGVRELLSTE